MSTHPVQGDTEGTSARAANRHAFLGSTAIVLGMLLLGRLAGLARDLVIAPLFGATASVDSLVAARTVPEIVLLVVTAGAISSGYLPAIALFSRDGETISAEGARALSIVTNWILVSTIAITIAGELFPKQFVQVVTPGLDAARLHQAAWLLRIMMPVTFLVSLAAILGALLNFRRIFALPSARAVVTNMAIILAMVLLAERFGIVSVAVGWLVGAGLQIVLLAPLGKKVKLGYRLDFDLRAPSVARVLKLMLPIMVAQFLLYGRTILERQFASWLPEGDLSYLNYSYRLALAPMLIVTNALTTVHLPELSRLGTKQAHEDFARILTRGVRLMWFATAPFVVVFLFAGEPLVRMLLEHGAFSAADTAATARLLRWYVAALVGGSLAAILAQAFYARGRGRVALTSFAIGLVVQGVVTALLLPRMGAAAVSIGTGAGLMVSTIVLLFTLGLVVDVPRRKWAALLPIPAMTGSVAMLIVMMMTTPLLRAIMPPISPDLAWVLSLIGGGLAYLLVLAIHAPPEVEFILSRMTRWRR